MLTRQEFSSLRQGLVGAWCPSLGASGYTLLDRSGRNNHGTLTNFAGSAPWVARGSGVAITTDGVDDWVSIANSPMPSGGADRTVCGWIHKPDDLTYGTFLDCGVYTAMQRIAFVVVGAGGYSGFTNRGVTLEFHTQTAGTNDPITLNRWTHIAASCGATLGTVQVWIDGMKSTMRYANNTASVINTVSSPLGVLGRQFAGGNSYGAATYDDIRIYNRILTPAEIRLLASRRGIGLSPLPDRGAALPRKLSVNVGGTWRAADAYVKVGGVWKLAQASTNVAGTWR